METTDELLSKVQTMRRLLDEHGAVVDHRETLKGFLSDLDEMFTRHEFVRTDHIMGIMELSSYFDAGRTTISGWDSRRDANGMPEPIADLGCGKIFDVSKVVRWWNAWKPVKGAKAGTTPEMRKRQ